MSPSLGGWSYDIELIEEVKKRIPQGSTILEFGSGDGTLALAESGFKVVTIEQNMEYMNRYIHDNISYNYVPLEILPDSNFWKGKTIMWYEMEKVKQVIPHEYSCIILDGPHIKNGCRAGFYINLDSFKPDALYVFDDVNRIHEYVTVLFCARRLKRDITIKNLHKRKQFAIL